MQSVVHFAVGAAGACLLVTWLDCDPHADVPLVLASGVWGMVPDGHHLLDAAGFSGRAADWEWFHRSPLADACWGHALLDSLETGRSVLEGTAATAGLLVAATVYVVFSDWPSA